MTAAPPVTHVPVPRRRSAPAAPRRSIVVKCPMVGTFYRSASPGAPGRSSRSATVVKAGDTLCIIEAMKLMNEIESDSRA